MSKTKCNDDLDIITQEPSGSISIIESAPENKTLYIIGEINECVANETVTALLETSWDEIKELHLYITSPGGYLADCFAIIDLLLHIKDKYDIKIFTYGLGEIASAGFFIFICGDERIIFPSCRVFVHTHITIGSDQTYEERIKADKTEEKEVYDNYVKYTAKQLHLSIAKTRNLLKKCKWLTKKEVKDYNIGIEEVLKGGNDVK
jgi:ATP-dependent protease ClpP protease subunit